MKLRTRLAVIFLIGTVLVPSTIYAEESRKPAYKPYAGSEFPLWLQALRRAEIVLVGSFPITMLMSSLSYDAYRSARNMITPPPVGERAEFGSFSADERMWLVVAGVSLAGIVALTDFLLDLKEQKTRAEQQQ